jgi:GT2 family glycosyltransferase
VGVVVVTYNSAGTVVDGLRTLPLSRLAQVVVVDNGSSDASAAVVRSLGLDRIEVVEQDNVGFGRGCQRGFDQMRADVDLVLFLNPDAIIEEPDLELLVAHLDAEPSCGMVAPLLEKGSELIASSGEIGTLRSELRFLLPDRLKELIPDRRHDPSASRTGPVGHVEGACFLMRASSLRRVGGFDPRYFMFFEEMDLARRLHAIGDRVDLVAEARASHLVGASRASEPLSGVVHLYRSTARYLHKWEGWPATLLYRIVATVAWSARAVARKLPPRAALDLIRAVWAPLPARRRPQAPSSG